MTSPIVQQATDGQLFTTSEAIAEGACIEHRAVLQTITKYGDDFERFGRVAFEMRPFETPGGTQQKRVAKLNEHQATLLLTYAKNTESVRRFKSDLVAAFYEMAQQLTAPVPTGPELLALAVVEAQQMIAAKDERIAEMAPKADYVDTFVADDDLLSFRTVAADLNVGEQALREQLIDAKWIYRQTTTRWSNTQQRKVPVYRYSAHADKRAYFQPVMHHDAPRFRGEVMHSLKVTPAGAAALARRFRRADEVVMAGECR